MTAGGVPAGVFVTATGTDVGKTFVCSGLIRAFRRANRPVEALKPVLSGFDAADPAASDTAVLLQALGRPIDDMAVAALSPWRFEAPLSPDMAARLEGRVIAVDDVVSACRAALVPGRTLVIEGVGGIMVPLDGSRTILDLVTALRLPVLLVAPTGLGAISYLLTALVTLKTRDLCPRAVVLSETPGSSVPLAMMVETLAPFVPRADLFVLRRSSGDQDATFDALMVHLDQEPALISEAPQGIKPP